MVPKRKRNVKVDTTEEYQIVDMVDLDPNNLEEFALPPIDTGMEAEEEKELHLEKIIDSGTGSIPIPIIKKIDNPARRYYKKIPLNTNFVNWKRDVKNSYSMESKDRQLCSKLGISEEEYLTVIDELEDDAYVKIENEDKLEEIRSSDISYTRSPLPSLIHSKCMTSHDGRTPLPESITQDTSYTFESQKLLPPVTETFVNPCLKDEHKEIIDPIVKKEIKTFARYRRLIRDEDKDHPSYVCFRRRVLKPSRKNRRSEAQTTEKIVRLDSELSLLHKLTNLRKIICEMNEKINTVNYEIYKSTAGIIKKYGKHGQKKLKKLFRNSKTGHNKLGVLNQGDIFKDILFDRDRIRLINKRLRQARENINDEEIEKEAIGYTNYLKKVYENILPK